MATRLAQQRPLAEWLPVCRDLLNDFFLPDSETEAALALIEQQWLAVIDSGLEAQYGEQVPLTLLRDELAQRLDQQRISQRFLAGPVNICTLMPMRSIPFKVVCLLGMNDGVYPRTLPPLGFDLMSQKPQRGDRSRRDDDRYLFLEALMSAEQTLYISYIGRSIRDNSERFPSVLVQELVDYIGQSHCLAGDEELDCDASEARVKAHITHLHTRMPFDVANFGKTRTRATLVNGWRPPASRERRIAILYSRSPRRRLTACRSISFCASGSTRYARSFSSVCGSISAPKRTIFQTTSRSLLKG